MTTHVIDCGHAVIRIEIADDHAHLTVMTPSFHCEDTHQPAESAMAYLEPDAVRVLVKALSEFVPRESKPALKSASRDH
jgi:hypothetical protein